MVSCCAVNCRNTTENSQCKFYKFPVSKHKLAQREKWIAAVKRVNVDGSPWYPKPWDRICSDHFIDKKMSNIEYNPNYIPRIFSDRYKRQKVNEAASHNRYNLFMKRRNAQKAHVGQDVQESTKDDLLQVIDYNENDKTDQLQNSINEVLFEEEVNETVFSIDKACQVCIFGVDEQPGKVFVCNQIIYSDHCDVAVQTDISDKTDAIISKKVLKNKKCGPDYKEFTDSSVTCDFGNAEENNERSFDGFSFIKTDKQLLEIAGVSFENFKFLLKRTIDSYNYKISKENRLFIFLVKMKTGLSFAALSIIFCVHRTTISRIFFATLHQLASATANLVFWREKDVVQATMPDCFKPEYRNTRVIIDFTELRIEIPADIDNRVFCYSTYKKGFTGKLLIGIIPCGLICYKSKLAGGRKSDSQIIIESKLMDLLEDGDEVLADKGFPEFKTVLNKSGKKVIVIMPPFLESNTEFTKEETEATYSIARVRIHVERIMQRIRLWEILNKIHANLFSNVDDIIHMACVLVNLQPPIIARQSGIKKVDRIEKRLT